MITLAAAVVVLERKAGNMRILAGAERGPGARAAGEKLRTEAEAIEVVIAELRACWRSR